METGTLRIQAAKKAVLLLKEGPLHLMLLLVAAATMLPFAWMLSTAFAPNEEAMTEAIKILPDTFTLINFVDVFRHVHFARYYFNSSFVATVILIGEYLTIVPAAYAFAKRDFPGKKVIFYAFLGSLMVPLHVIIIPVYILMDKLGWINTYQGLIVPFLTSAFGIFLLRQFFMTVPNQLLDAARIDGCSELRLMWSVLVRCSKPALIAFGVFSFVRQWNNYFWALIVVEKKDLFTVPVALARLQDWELGIEWGFVMAAATLAIAPLVIIFFLAQKSFVQGITMTGLKG